MSRIASSDCITPLSNVVDPHMTAVPTRLRHSSVVFLFATMMPSALAEPCLAQRVLHVDDSATGANDGSSWPHAFHSLQSALAIAGVGDEIWLAEGLYRPDTGIGHLPLERLETFAIAAGVRIYGSFAGFETSVASRAGSPAQTILSGDLLGNDHFGDLSTYSDNSFHVVTISGEGPGRYIDGVTISRGYAQHPNSLGGGCLLLGAEAHFKGCVFSNNEGVRSAGVHLDTALPITFTSCTFAHNHAWDDGGAIGMPTTTAPVLTACTIVDNSASGGPNSDGGGIYGGRGVYLSCLIARNRADNGAGAYLGATSRFVGCTVVWNTAAVIGGGIWTNVPQVVDNSILWDNADTNGSGESSQFLAVFPGSAVNYCDIQGLTGALGGTGNLSIDPHLITTADGDYHLSAMSPCIDRGIATLPGMPAIDLDGAPRVVNCRVDIGCDETLYAPDCDDNGTADGCDIASNASLDDNHNGIPDICEPTGSPFCFGDGTGTMCPCANTGDPGHGCLSSFGLEGGGLLVAGGLPSLSADTVCLEASHLPPTTTGIFFQGNDRVNGGLGRSFGDGLRCVTSNTVRLATRTAALGSMRLGACSAGDGPISSQEPVPSAVTRHYQVWYRNSDPTYCTTSLFNLTNAMTIHWLP